RISTTRTALSVAARSSASANRSYMALVSALRLSGRFSAMVRTPFAKSVVRCSVISSSVLRGAPPDHALGVGLGDREAAALEAVQVRQAFAGGHAHQVVADRAREQGAEHVDRTLGLLETIEQPRQRLLVAAVERVEPHVQLAERVAVRRQHQQLWRQRR